MFFKYFINGIFEIISCCSSIFSSFFYKFYKVFEDLDLVGFFFFLGNWICKLRYFYEIREILKLN